ncbi:MAG: YbjN domain-containing protein [Propioniciclava sp.]
MGFFDKPGKGGLESLSQGRFARLFDANNVNYGTDDDGDIMAGFGPGMFWLMAAGSDGDILRIQSRWMATIPADQYDRVVQLGNDFNASHYFPRCFAQRDEAGDVIAFCDIVADCTSGVTDEQLDIYISAATTTANQYYDVLAQEYPDIAAGIEVD